MAIIQTTAEKFEVVETVEQINEEINESQFIKCLFIILTTKRNLGIASREIWININHIVSFY